MQNTSDRMQWVFDNAPSSAMKGRYAPLQLAMMALGATNSPFQSLFGNSLYSQFYDQAISRGQNPYETLPWLNGSWGGSGASPGSKPNASSSDPLASMPQWYRDWYRTQGQHGGVPPVGGLL
jgi:hypothetical protein